MHKILLIAFSIGLLSCSQSKLENDDKNVHWSIKPERFGIDNISKGYDSLQIRIWYLSSIVPPVAVLTIKQESDGQFTGTIRRVYIMYKEDGKGEMTLAIEKIKSNDLKPKTEWNHVINTMNELKLFSLPDMNEIPEFKEGDGFMDGDSYVVEIARKNYYRTYSYHVPDYFQKEHWQVKRMVQILDLADSEFGIPWNRKRDEWRMYHFVDKLDKTCDSVVFNN